MLRLKKNRLIYAFLILIAVSISMAIVAPALSQEQEDNFPGVRFDTYAPVELRINQGLYPGGYIESNNRRYKLYIQEDGNLVLYRTNGDRMRAVWDTGTEGRAVQAAIMQGDGNFVLYGYNEPYWATDTRRGSRIVVQDDGNVVVYDIADRPVWSIF